MRSNSAGFSLAQAVLLGGILFISCRETDYTNTGRPEPADSSPVSGHCEPARHIEWRCVCPRFTQLSQHAATGCSRATSTDWCLLSVRSRRALRFRRRHRVSVVRAWTVAQVASIANFIDNVNINVYVYVYFNVMRRDVGGVGWRYRRPSSPAGRSRFRLMRAEAEAFFEACGSRSRSGRRRYWSVFGPGNACPNGSAVSLSQQPLLHAQCGCVSLVARHTNTWDTANAECSCRKERGGGETRAVEKPSRHSSSRCGKHAGDHTRDGVQVESGARLPSTG